MQTVVIPEDDLIPIDALGDTCHIACKLAMDMFHIGEEDLYEEIDGILTVGDFYERAKGEGTHLLFI